MNTEDLHQEIWPALESLAGAKLAVYDGIVPETPAANYAVLWMGGTRAVSTRVGWRATDLACDFQITCVGRNPRSCAATVDLVRAKFTGLRLGDQEDPNAPRCKENANPPTPPPDKSVPGDIRFWMPLPYRVDTSI